MRTVGHVVALVPDEVAAESVTADLSHHGIRAEILPPEPGVYPVEDQSFRDHLRGAGQGLLIGAVLGAIFGLFIVLMVPAARDLGLVAKVLLIGGIAIQGTMPAMMWRMGRADHYDDDPAEVRVPESPERLVVVDDEPHEPLAHRVIEHHSGVFLDADRPIEPAA
jgi:hypothetical protein